MTRFYCPNCKRWMSGKKQWLDFFIMWVALDSIIAVILLLFIWSQAVTITSLETIYEIGIIGAGLMVISPFLAYWVASEKCPTCNLSISDAELLNEIERKTRKGDSKASSLDDDSDS